MRTQASEQACTYIIPIFAFSCLLFFLVKKKMQVLKQTSIEANMHLYNTYLRFFLLTSFSREKEVSA